MTESACNPHLPEEFYALREEVAVLKAQLKERDKALLLANEVLNAWKINSNEWRGALTDANTRFATTDEVKALLSKEEAKREALAATVAALEKNRSEQTGKSSGINLSWGIAVTLVLVLIGIIGLILKAKP